MSAPLSPNRPPEPSEEGPHGERPRRLLEVGLIAAFWISLYMLTIGQRVIDPRGKGSTADLGQLAAEAPEFGLWLLLTPVIFWLVRRFSIERDSWRRHALLHVGLAFGVAVAMDLFGHWSHNLVADEWQRPVTLSFSLFALHFLDEFIIYLTVLAAGVARDYFLRYQERQREAAELRAQTAELEMHATQLEARLAEARLQALRMQINPHFLFNTLHTISTYLERDPRGARRMIARLSDLLRYTLEMTGVQEVPLRQEMAFLDSYLEIQRIRFQDHLQIEEKIDPDAMDGLVPSLILQPLVENAVKHGVSQIEGVGRIEVRAWREGDRLQMSVRDNGPGLGPSGDGAASRPGRGVGLRNTRERLEGLYGDDQSLELVPGSDGGLVALVTLPFHTSADLYTTAVSE